MFTREEIDQAKRVDLVSLAQEVTTLRRVSRRGEWEGPCPRCGGSKRFHVHADGWFFCRHCHPRRGDAIDFVRWIGWADSFSEAVSWLLER